MRNRSSNRKRQRRGGQIPQQIPPQYENPSVESSESTIAKKARETTGWLSSKFSGLFGTTPAVGPAVGGSRRRRGSRGKSFLGMFNIFSRKRSRSRRSRGKTGGAPLGVLGAPAAPLGAPAAPLGAPAAPAIKPLLAPAIKPVQAPAAPMKGGSSPYYQLGRTITGGSRRSRARKGGERGRLI